MSSIRGIISCALLFFLVVYASFGTRVAVLGILDVGIVGSSTLLEGSLVLLEVRGVVPVIRSRALANWKDTLRER